MMNRRKKIFFFALLSLLVLYISYWSQYSLYRYFLLYREKKEINNQIVWYEQQYAADSAKIQELDNSQDEIEATARSLYLMKKQQEDIYITIDPDSIQE